MPGVNEEAKECPSSHDDERVCFSASESIEKEVGAKESRSQYETLLDALKLAHAREANLVDQCRELHTQNIGCASELKASKRSIQEFVSQVNSLQSDSETVRSLLESANEREDRAKVTIDKSEIEQHQVSNESKQLARHVDEWKKRAAAANEKICAMEIDQQKLKSQAAQQQVSLTEQKENNASVKEHLSEKNDEIERGNERRDRVEKELENVQSKLVAKTKVRYSVSLC